MKSASDERSSLSGGLSPGSDGWFYSPAFPAVCLDEAGLILDVNDIFARTFGVVAATVIGCRLDSLVAVEAHVALSATFTDLRANPQNTRQMDLCLCLPGCHSRWFRVVFYVPRRIGAPSDQVCIAAQLCEIDDLTTRAQGLADLAQSWNEAMGAAKIGIWDADLVSRVSTFSDMWYQIRGLKRGDPAPARHDEILEFIHPSDRKHVMEEFARQRLPDFKECRYEYRYKHSDGRWIWIECRGSCAQRVDGKVVRIIGSDIDITERKLAEEQLSLATNRLQLAMEALRVGVFDADFSTGYTYWDAPTRAIYGVASDQRIEFGGLWESLLYPDDRDRVLRAVDEHITKLTPYDNQFRIIRPDGCVRHIRTRTLPFIDVDGSKRMIGINWDETEDILLRLDLERAKTLAEARNRELEIAKAEIERIAMLDPLTELPNRRFLDHRMSELAAQGFDCEHGLAILHIDLDRFKQINDTFGHSVGDAVLQHVGRLLQGEAGGDGQVFRIGGDEFVMVRLFDGDYPSLEAMATRLVEILRRPVTVRGHDCRFGASIGIAIGVGKDIEPQQLLLNADIGLYCAKSGGKNRWEYFRRESHDRMILTKHISDDILRGLERDEFKPHYQLQFRAGSLDITGVEALARWYHPERGILTPDKFVTIADELGILGEIDGVILKKAIADCQLLEQSGIHIPKYSVNVSAGRLRDPHLAEILAALPAERCPLSFELLESIFLDELEDQVAVNIAHIRKAGIGIEIDDFGSGHASITSLLHLRPDVIKIDRQLVSTIPTSAERRSLIGAIIEMGHSLGVTVVGEGVETKEHAHWLHVLKCDLLQGFGLALPMPANELINFIDAQSWRQHCVAPAASLGVD
ncbi:EAL domain-containing protein [Pleomorphomonas oryzae]|uniref:EAL domain-containing protein n=1 Tax=Pleomorphomonas oryzae TaxID=261934 RepID=UPI0006885E60|nr:EAL domain-containing protein [Pleomorphomonas oryzae]